MTEQGKGRLSKIQVSILGLGGGTIFATAARLRRSMMMVRSCRKMIVGMADAVRQVPMRLMIGLEAEEAESDE